jgi:hypothetical protein
VAALAVAAAACVSLAACGAQPQDATVPKGNFPVQITAASFPAAQTLSQHAQMVIAVRNAGNKAIPNLAISVCPYTCSYTTTPGHGTSSAVFDSNVDQDSLDNPSTPNWVVERQPGPCSSGMFPSLAQYNCQGGGGGAYATQDPDTWASGRLAPGATVKFVWSVVAMKTDPHVVVAWQVNADLFSKARAVLANGGGTPAGTFVTRITNKPAQTYINNNGQIVPGSGQGHP